MPAQHDRHELPPRPEPQIEIPPTAPGGVDAVAFPTGPHGTTRPAVRDADPRENPATSTALPETPDEGEDTSTRATRGEEEPDARHDSPA